MDSSDGAASGTEPRTQDTKAKRVRTGCLTCRERHLKCDETKPVCNNCAKSQRNCKVGVRLNFIDTQIKDVPHIIPLPENCDVVFQDESREIASEYKGGAALYGSRRNQAPRDDSAGPVNGTSLAMHPHPNAAHGNAFYMDMQHTSTSQSLPSIHVGLPDSYPAEPQNMGYDHESQQAGPSHHHNHSHSDSTFSTATMNGHGGYPPAPEQSVTPEDIHDLPEGQMREYLNSQEEVLFMQVFVEEVGLWMDSMDPQKHVRATPLVCNSFIDCEQFSRLLPFHSLGEPMLLNAFLACGARHLSLVNSKYSEEKALHYYDTATRFLLDSLQNPDRNTVVCATTAVILNVYEIMCEKALQRMNHIAGARALIKECGWNARAIGIGAACFWLNVGMELLSCLHFNWQVAWDPDDWGVDMDFTRESLPGREEVWCYRMVYIVAKIANFRATIPRTQDLSQPNGQHRLRARLDEWRRLKKLADSWNESIPRTMHPMAYLYPGQTLSGSAFPEVWLIKRTSIVARLFYHTAMCLLAQINPVSGPEQPEMRDLQQRHSQLICGISAHVKDRYIPLSIIVDDTR